MIEIERYDDYFFKDHYIYGFYKDIILNARLKAKEVEETNMSKNKKDELNQRIKKN